MPAPAPLPGQFDQDPRVSFDKTAGKFQYEDEETGQEFEWTGVAWVPLVDEELWKAQQSAYSVAGVDESTPANAVVAREERRNKKRKKGEVDYTSNGASSTAGAGSSSSSAAAAVKSDSAPKPSTQSVPKQTAVWVTNLPPDTTVAKLETVFSKAGVLMIGNDGESRVKLYYDDDGKFKGEALVMYFKEGSVDLAVRLLDDTELEMGAGNGNMKVEEAKYIKAADKATGTAAKVAKEEQAEKKQYSAEEKQRMTKRIRAMQNKVTWHSDDESDEEGAPALTDPKPLENRANRVVVLKGMFVLKDLEKDPGLLLELKEDVREEAESFGQVTSLTLYDKEEDGVMTIKFKDPQAAQACILKMNNRFFDGRRIYAGTFNGRERYRKSGKGGGSMLEEENEQEEKERLDKFARWLVDGDGDGDAAE